MNYHHQKVAVMQQNVSTFPRHLYKVVMLVYKQAIIL